MSTPSAAAVLTQPVVAWRFRLRPPTGSETPIVLIAENDGTVVELVPGKTGLRLRCRVALVVATAVMAHRRATGQAVPPGMVAGEMIVDVALAAAAETVEVVLSLRAERIALYCDGALVDEEWPFTARRGSGTPRIQRADLVEALVVAADGDEPLCSAAAQARWLPDARPFGAYWRPAGENASAGDTMVCVRNDELHVFWLADRRWHQSKWGAGAHQFDHAVTTNLSQWRQLPRAVAIDAPEVTIGTGSCVHDGERFHLFWHNHGERFLAPEGTFVSTSSDGADFTVEKPWQRSDLIQPGVWREGTSWRMLCHTRLYASTDLRDWKLLDAHFITMPAGVSEECPCVFAVGDRFWLLTGRAGCWSWRSGERPRAHHDQAPYDGLMVPMVAAWRGRLIMAGWAYDDAKTLGIPWTWGGTVVFRELLPRVDGSGFTMRWVPELIPGGGAWSAALPDTTIAAGGATALTVPAGAIHVRLHVVAEGDVALVFGGGADGVGGTEIRIEPAAQRLVAASAVEGPFTGRASREPFLSHDFAMPAVTGLAAMRQIDAIIWPDRGGVVIDVQLDTGRTMVARHVGAWRGGAMLATRGGAAQVMAEVRTLQR